MRIKDRKGHFIQFHEQKQKLGENFVIITENNHAKIFVKEWKYPAYIKILFGVEKSSRYDMYMIMKREEKFGKSPNFYANVGRFFLENNNKNLGTRILSNLAELDLENPQLLRMLAFQLDDPSLSVSIFRQILSLRPEEPQSYRDLALSLIKFGNSEINKLIQGSRNFFNPKFLAISEIFSESLELLTKIVQNEKKWDVRFSQIEITALTDVMRLLKHGENNDFVKLKDHVDKRLVCDMDVDLRVTIQWDTDMTDVELLVIEPNGECCYSFNNKTSNKGMVSRNFTNGYGPQEYLVRHAVTGVYIVKVKLFASPETAYGTTVLVNIWTDFGRPVKEKESTCFVRLEKAKQVETVARIYF